MTNGTLILSNNFLFLANTLNPSASITIGLLQVLIIFSAK